MAPMTSCVCNCDGGTCVCRPRAQSVTYYHYDGSVDRAVAILSDMPCQCVGVKVRIGRVITTKCGRCRALNELKGA
jgi:hypothetical protein